jgi:hypothetical protein
VQIVAGRRSATIPYAAIAHGGEDDVGRAALMAKQDRGIATVEIELSQVADRSTHVPTSGQ